MKRIAALVRLFDLYDLLAVAGVVLTGYGSALIFFPLGFVVPGVALSAYAWWGIAGGGGGKA